MKLVITMPASVLVDEDNVLHVRAEDETGAFGIEPGHADFLTVLEISVLTWRDHTDGEHHVALRGGILSVNNDTVAVASREAVGEDTFERLGRAVLERFRQETREEETAWISAAQLNVAMVRQLHRYLESDHTMTPARQSAYNPAQENGEG